MTEEQTFNLGNTGDSSPRGTGPWQPGSATGIGSLPGEHPLEAARTIHDALPEFPHLAELPARGPGADMIGRTAGLLVDIPVEITAGGWRIAERPGRDVRRARSYLSADLDALEEVFDGWSGPLKLQVAGPWTLAAALEQPRSLNPALADPGLVADLAASLAEGTAIHVAEVAKRLPRATLVVQVDEPSLSAVAEGGVPTASGLGRVRAPDEEFLRERLGQVVTATTQYTIVHTCSQDVSFGIIRGAGADALSLDISQLRTRDFDLLAETAEAGHGLLFGIAERALAAPEKAARSAAEVWRRMGLSPAKCARQVVLTPACGLAGSSPEAAQKALRLVREAATILPEILEG
ncbi:MAG TPA: methionine synthase [Trebonia sp.]|nr:methionine synthase [Trebonia sp.]